LPAFFVGAVALTAVWLTRPLWHDPETTKLHHYLTTARHRLDEPNARPDALILGLSEVWGEIDKHCNLAGEVQFLLGSAYVRLAEERSTENPADLWRKARSHLEEAETLGVRDTDRTRLDYRLAKALSRTQADPRSVIARLDRCFDDAEDRFEAYGLLADAYLRLPDPRAALDATQKQVQLPVPDERVLAAVRLRQAELLLQLHEPGSRDAARKTLSRISPDAAKEIVARARLVCAWTYVEEQKWDEAAPVLEQIVGDPHGVQADVGLVWYWLGLCRDNLHQTKGAIEAWRKAVPAGGDAAKAAHLYLGLALVRTGNFAQGLEEIRTFAAGISKPEDYRNSVVNLAEAQRLLEAACQSYQQATMFEAALEVVRIQARFAKTGAVYLVQGRVAEAWAKTIWEKASSLQSVAKRRDEETAARKRFHEAGGAFEAAADLAADSTVKADGLWRAAECYRQAQDYRLLVAVLDRFIALQPPLAQLNEAWFRLGEAHHALGNGTAADTCFRRCIETAGPLRFRARFQLAVSEIERNHLAEAEEQLTMSLQQLRAETDREAHENTLFLLAEVLFRRANYRGAALRWEQALTLYPASANAPLGRFKLGDCYRRLADAERQQPHAGDPPDMLEHYRKQYAFYLDQAATNYQKVIDALEARRMTGPLAESETSLLRDALFLLAQCRFDRGQYEEAARLNDALAARFQQSYDAFLALKQLYGCQLLVVPLDKPQRDKARATLQRARVLLNRLDDSAFRDRPPIESREDSEKWLKDCEQLLDSLDRAK
jgi:tetratricopeptide (TPR) repeat protein